LSAPPLEAVPHLTVTVECVHPPPVHCLQPRTPTSPLLVSVSPVPECFATEECALSRTHPQHSFAPRAAALQRLQPGRKARLRKRARSRASRLRCSCVSQSRGWVLPVRSAPFAEAVRAMR
jgi:hypothetical protein